MPDRWPDNEPIDVLVERVRVESGRSQYALADDLRRVSGNPSVDHGYVYRWETRRRIPTPYWREHLSVALDIPRAVLDRAAAVAKRQRTSSRTTDPSSDGIRGAALVTPATSVPEITWSDSVTEVWRAAVELLGASPDAGASDGGDAEAINRMTLRWLVAAPDEVRSRTTGRRWVGVGDVRRVRAVRQALKLTDDAHGGGTALPMALGYLRGEVKTLLVEGSYDNTTGRLLLEAVAELVLDAGWMAYDQGVDQRLARRYMLQALRLAHAAGNRLLGGRILGALSHQALHMGDVPLALDLIRAARAGTAQAAPPKVVAMLAALEGCAHAAGNDVSACTASLVAAERALSRIRSGSEDPEWLDFDEGGLWGHAARAHRDLALIASGSVKKRRARAARRYAERSVDLCRRNHSRTRAQRNAILAGACLQLGEVEEASAVATRVLPDAWNVNSTHVYADVAGLVESISATGARASDFLVPAQELLATV